MAADSCSVLSVDDCRTARRSQDPSSPNSTVPHLACMCSPENAIGASLSILTEEYDQEKANYSDFNTNKSSASSCTAGKEELWKFPCLLLSLRQEEIFTCAGVAPGHSFFPEIEGCETLDYVVVIIAYWLLFLSHSEAALRRVPLCCSGTSEDKLIVHLV